MRALTWLRPSCSQIWLPCIKCGTGDPPPPLRPPLRWMMSIRRPIASSLHPWACLNCLLLAFLRSHRLGGHKPPLEGAAMATEKARTTRLAPRPYKPKKALGSRVRRVKAWRKGCRPDSLDKPANKSNPRRWRSNIGGLFKHRATASNHGGSAKGENDGARECLA